MQRSLRKQAMVNHSLTQNEYVEEITRLNMSLQDIVEDRLNASRLVERNTNHNHGSSNVNNNILGSLLKSKRKFQNFSQHQNHSRVQASEQVTNRNDQVLQGNGNGNGEPSVILDRRGGHVPSVPLHEVLGGSPASVRSGTEGLPSIIHSHQSYQRSQQQQQPHTSRNHQDHNDDGTPLPRHKHGSDVPGMSFFDQRHDQDDGHQSMPSDIAPAPISPLLL
eukprot:TRINITY_DN95392_c0_g2_i2.p1 TRINITY_DN95392_c0_g2~~TRINITY_DN95392_c0_g2_i2.p1  ORF type:complete len:221 (+),score=60.11 TRINITY_DN95392_c0_g2_i2:99-761(+)